LWNITEPLAKYSPKEPVKYMTLENLSASLRSWYFSEKGGMFLSHKSRVSYEYLQKGIQEILKGEPLRDIELPRGSEEDPTTLDYIIKKGSELRTQLTQDVLSRMASKIGGEQT
jgi:hypothetical protein